MSHSFWSQGIANWSSRYRTNNVAVGRSCERERVNCTGVVVVGTESVSIVVAPNWSRLSDFGRGLSSAQLNQTRLRCYSPGGSHSCRDNEKKEWIWSTSSSIGRWLCVAWSSPLMGYIIIVVVVEVFAISPVKSGLPGLVHKNVLSRRIGEAI